MAFFAQLAPAPPPPQDIGGGQGGLYVTVGAIALGVVLLVFLALLIRRLVRARSKVAAPGANKELPPEQQRIEVKLPPSAAEQAKVREAEEAKAKADALRAQ